MLTPQHVARTMGGEAWGNQILIPGPGHSRKDRSLSIRLEEGAPDGFLVHSFAGDDPIVCKQYIREKLGLQLRTRGAELSAQGRRHIEDRTDWALTVWQRAMSAGGTLVETYLGSRGLRLPSGSRIRFHTELKHRSGGVWPAMVALATGGVDDEPRGIHRTFLAHDGSGKAPVDPQKMMLGPCRGAAVRLAPAGQVLMVGEGIETSLTAMQVTGYPAWAALSASGLQALGLPPDVRDVIILADGDEAGKAAARGAALRWKRESRRVRIAHAPEGMDFNDMLLGKSVQQ
jgi:hypothetical protein